MIKIGGPKGAFGSSISFREYAQPSQDRRIARLQSESQALSLVDLKQAKKGISELRQAFEYLQEIQTPKPLRGANQVSRAVPTPSAINPDYRISVTTPLERNTLISHREADSASINTQAARLREREGIGSTNEDRNTTTLTISLLSGLSSQQLAQEEAKARGVVAAWHDAALTGTTATLNGAALERQDLSRALVTLDYVEGGLNLGADSDNWARTLYNKVDPGSDAGDAAIHARADAHIASLTRGELADRFGEVVQSLKSVASNRSTSGPNTLTGRSRQSSFDRPQVVSDLRAYEAIKARLAPIQEGGGDTASQVRFGYAIGSRSADVSLRNDADTALAGLTFEELSAQETQADDLLNSAFDLLNGGGIDPGTIDRERLIYALRVKDKLAATQAPTQETFAQRTIQADYDTQSLRFDSASQKAAITLTGDPDAPTGFRLLFGIPDELEGEATIAELKARHETLGLNSPIQAGSFTILGQEITIRESDTLREVRASLQGALASQGDAFNMAQGYGAFTGTLRGSAQTLDFSEDTTGLLSVLGLKGLSITLSPSRSATSIRDAVGSTRGALGSPQRLRGRLPVAPLDGEGGDTLPLRGRLLHRGANKGAKKKGIEKLNKAFKELAQSFGLRGMKSDVGKAFSAMADSLSARGVPGLEEAGKGFMALSESHDFVSVMEALNEGESINTLASLLNQSSEDGDGDVGEALYGQLVALESQLVDLVTG